MVSYLKSGLSVTCPVEELNKKDGWDKIKFSAFQDQDFLICKDVS